MHRKRSIALLLSSQLLCFVAISQNALQLPALHDQWTIQNRESISLNASDHKPYNDHIEMSGSKVSLWLRYSVDTAGHLQIKRTVIFPTFRMKPNDTHASMMYTYTDEDLPRFFINNNPLRPEILNGHFLPGINETVEDIKQDGIMEVKSKIVSKKDSLQVIRKLFPSVDKPAALEQLIFRNEGTTPVQVAMEYLSKVIKTDASMSTPRSHSIIASTINPHTVLLQPGDSTMFGISYLATDDTGTQTSIDLTKEELARNNRMTSFAASLQLETPDTVLNTMFEFAKRRISESIYQTKAGPMMGPGGLTYYAAIWANDNAEYANPFYPFTGDSLGNAAAINTYGMFAAYMNKDFKPIPSSIIAEGDDIWAGAGDRGDQAMIAYGASRFALAYGKADTARKLWPLIEWCLEYCNKKKNEEGVILSDHDELEGRFPAGNANLNTSCLYYDALVSASQLATSLGLPASKTKTYQHQAAQLKNAIEEYFGAQMKGFHTYKYYKENTLLRSWICVPLAMGIYDRAPGTVGALFSPALFSSEGFLTEEGNQTFWDRSTLYALRGLFAAGETTKALPFLHYYSQKRLLGNHVPYPVEAYPEGNQRHLAAESALYCRIFTEGIFGIRPAGFHRLQLTPRLPSGWNRMALHHVKAFTEDMDIAVERNGNRLQITITTAGNKQIIKKIKEGEVLAVDIK